MCSQHPSRPPNKHMQRAGTHKVLGRGRMSPVPCSAPRARVLTCQPAGADVNRYATLMRFLMIVAAAVLTASCAHYPPGYSPAKDACSGPIPDDGMHRVVPNAEEVMGIWRALDLKQGEVIEGWFEDRVGNVKVGITDGPDHWEAALVRTGSEFSLNDTRWRELQIVCVG
jgi:hypothetical protein